MYKFAVMVLSVLTVNIVTGFISLGVTEYNRSRFGLVAATTIGMAVLVLVLYPLFTYLDSWTTASSRILMKTGKKMLGRRVGMALVFFAALAVLFVLYARYWFQVDMVRIVLGRFWS